MSNDLRVLNQNEIDTVSGGIVCLGFCVLGAIVVGVGLLVSGAHIGKTLAQAL